MSYLDRILDVTGLARVEQDSGDDLVAEHFRQKYEI